MSEMPGSGAGTASFDAPAPARPGAPPGPARGGKGLALVLIALAGRNALQEWLAASRVYPATSDLWLIPVISGFLFFARRAHIYSQPAKPWPIAFVPYAILVGALVILLGRTYPLGATLLSFYGIYLIYATRWGFHLWRLNTQTFNQAMHLTTSQPETHAQRLRPAGARCTMQ